MKTADELGISDLTYDYLLRVRKMMDNPGFEKEFSMKDYSNPCGTVCCIVGHMASQYNIDENIINNIENIQTNTRKFFHNSIWSLYHPDFHIRNWRKVTLQNAKDAIDIFLETGNPNWKLICPEFFDDDDDDDDDDED